MGAPTSFKNQEEYTRMVSTEGHTHLLRVLHLLLCDQRHSVLHDEIFFFIGESLVYKSLHYSYKLRIL